MHCPLGVLVLAARSIMFFMKGVWLSIKPIEFQQLILKDKILGEGGGGRNIVCFPIYPWTWNGFFWVMISPFRSWFFARYWNLTYARLFLNNKLDDNHTSFKIKCFQSVRNGIEYMTSAIISYSNGKHAIISIIFRNLSL